MVLFLGGVTLIAKASGIALILFPELAALTHDVLIRPDGRWAKQPMQLVITPTLTALVGLLLTRHLHYGAISMVLVVALSLAVIRFTRSAIAPAISAGLLPMVLGERSWIYPLAIFLGLGMLLAVLVFWNYVNERLSPSTSDRPEDSRIVDQLEAVPHDRFWAASLLFFVLVLGGVAQKSGLRFLVFPPLIVIAYELLGHPEVPDWMKRPVLFPVVCSLTASIGLSTYRLLHFTPLAVMCSAIGSMVMLRLFSMHMPPALAIGLLPFVMTSPNYMFPVSVLFGTTALSLYFYAYRRLRRPDFARRSVRAYPEPATPPSSYSSPSP